MQNTKITVIEGEFNDKKITLETGRLAKLARSAVLVTCEGTAVLVAISSKAGAGNTDFLPLKIDYEERYYAAGKIRGNKYQRREGNPNEDAIINARLIDHAIRPLFSKDFVDETQVVVTVLSVDGVNSPALLGFLATSAALSISGLPFHGPIVQVNIEIHDSHLAVNLEETDHHSKMHLHAAFTNEGKLVQAIEAEGKIIPEQEVFEAVKFGSESVKPLFDLLNKFKNAIEVEPLEYNPSWLSDEVKDKFKKKFFEKLDAIEENGNPFEKKSWDKYYKQIIKDTKEEVGDEYSEDQLHLIFSEVQKLWVRRLVLEKGKRVDGRGFDEVRELSADVGLFPRLHGSALFNRGMTQGIVITTLGSVDDTMTIQNIDKDREKRYFHHYNFPPYTTGEVGRVGGANRRAIGHGLLAEKALLAVLPAQEEFPYVIRTVSEMITSNGSTSMAATSGSSLSLMDAGVPIKEHVGGIAIGLFVDSKKEDPKAEDFTLLTDITGTEDFSGYMDYKMTGTRNGVTAIQMELKLKGVPIALLEKIVEHSKVARQKVLDVMYATIAEPRKDISEFAPRIDTVRIEKDQIGYVIGSGGKMIKELVEKLGVELKVEEKETEGLISISSTSREALANAKDYIMGMLREVKVGDVYDGVVTRIEGYGAFVEILPKQEGLLHVSEFSHGFTSDMNEVLNVGDKIKVQIKGTENGKISLSKKSLEEETEEQKAERESRANQPREFGGDFGDRRGGFDRRSGGHDRRTDGNRGRSNGGRPSDRGGFSRDRGSRDGGFRPYR